ncbi:MAG TPA: IPTL-CTERM sorting domain-containing protein, partial [Thermoanaerobaculia bacterium]
ADNPGDEFTDTLPAGLTLTGASATSGVAATSGNTATWNGAIPAGGSVTISITANIDPGTAGMTLCNQATIAYDADGDGTNESIGFSDDPDEPGPADPCCFRVLFMKEIPALSGDGLAALALLLAGLAVLRLRRRPL